MFQSVHVGIFRILNEFVIFVEAVTFPRHTFYKGSVNVVVGRFRRVGSIYRCRQNGSFHIVGEGVHSRRLGYHVSAAVFKQRFGIFVEVDVLYVHRARRCYAVFSLQRCKHEGVAFYHVHGNCVHAFRRCFFKGCSCIDKVFPVGDFVALDVVGHYHTGGFVATHNVAVAHCGKRVVAVDGIRRQREGVVACVGADNVFGCIAQAAAFIEVSVGVGQQVETDIGAVGIVVVQNAVGVQNRAFEFIAQIYVYGNFKDIAAAFHFFERYGFFSRPADSRADNYPVSAVFVTFRLPMCIRRCVFRQRRCEVVCLCAGGRYVPSVKHKAVFFRIGRFYRCAALLCLYRAKHSFSVLIVQCERVGRRTSRQRQNKRHAQHYCHCQEFALHKFLLLFFGFLRFYLIVK
ncbi:unknown [Corallococcus sp. CAG:1435]|nr:unknown [Corallococcus sp. CAG:1435]